MDALAEMEVMGHEEVVRWHERACGYRGIIAVHSTALGPAVGGTRMWRYATEADALRDALRLSRGMTYKSAAAGLPLGGGKSVIVLPEGPFDRAALLRAHGRAVEALRGRYITAEDVGTSPADMAVIREETTHVAGLEGRSGDPSPWTARGVLRAIRGAALARWGSDDLSGRRVALQGCGNVGRHLATSLAELGAELVVSDIDPERAHRVATPLGAAVVAPQAIFSADADIFAPCALGGVLNADTIPLLRAKVVAGAANNQLLEPADGDRLRERGILYVPDYIANAGGVINGCREIVGWDADRARRQVDAIHDRTLEVLRLAEASGVAPHRAADLYAEERIRSSIAAPPPRTPPPVGDRMQPRT